MNEKTNMKIGLIAGGGNFPRLFADAARTAGYEVYAAAYLNAAEADLENHVTQLKWLHIGEIERLLQFFERAGVTQTVMMGGVKKTNLFEDIKPDAKCLALIGSMTETHDDILLRKFADLMEEHGITVRESTFLLPDILATKGCWTKQGPGEMQKIDIDIGWKVAKAVGRLDVGQCVVVEEGTVLAVEAIDGTDATIVRGGSLGGGNAVLVKVCKPQQDLRFDIPAVGADTIRTMRTAGVKTLAIEAGKAVVFDKEKMIAMADDAGMCIVAMEEGEA